MKPTAIKEIIRLFRAYGDLEYGESISVNSHSLQAALQAIDRGYKRKIVLAAFLHDIGHLIPLDMPDSDVLGMGQFGMVAHETIGANYLRKQEMPESICQPIAMHVETKRYLCATDPSYYDLLSEASKQTLKYQGGIMSENEVAQFRDHPFYNSAIKVRLLDDSAKDPDFKVIDSYWYYFEQLLAGHTLAKQND